MCRIQTVQDLYFPVREDVIFKAVGEYSPIDRERQKIRDANFKGIYTGDKLVSVMKNSYKLIPNRQIVEPLLEQFDKMDIKYEVERQHSFVTDGRMRLHVRFPDMKLKDDDSDIDMSLYIHNSYDGSEGVRLFWGAIRAICSNGMVWGTVLNKFYSRHTNGFKVHKVISGIQSTYDKIPMLQAKIDETQESYVPMMFLNQIKEKVGLNVFKFVIESLGNPQIRETETINQYKLLNLVTNYISHQVNIQNRARYQMAASKLFKL